MAAQLFRLAYPAERVAALYADEFCGWDEAAIQGVDRVVLKAHKPSPTLCLLAHVTDLPILLTVRDPRDAVASLMSRFGLDFELALARVEASGHALLPLLSRPNMLLLRYEDDFTGCPGSVEAIARFLRVPLAAAKRDALFAALTPEAVTATIADLQARSVFADLSPAETWDPETHWHPSHVGDGRVGKWADYLSEAQTARVMYSTRRFRAALGYGGATPVALGTELDFSLDGTGASHLGEGFSEVEHWGIWTEAGTATLRLALQERIGTVLHLELLCMLDGVALRTDLPGGSMRVLVNGRLMAELRASAANPTHVLFVFRLEDAAMAGWDSIELCFEARGLPCPAECGLGSESRRLGIGLVRMRVDVPASAERPASPTLSDG